MIVKVEKNMEVTLTKEFLSELSLQEGDLLDCIIYGGSIHLLPLRLPFDKPTESPPVSPSVYVTMFGQFNIRIQNEYITISNKKAKELLAYLIVHNGMPLHKLTLAEFLWPQTAAPKAMDNLYKTIRYLKNNTSLNTYFPLLISRGEIQLDISKIACDFLLFEQYCTKPNDIIQLRKAVDLYQGPLLFEEYYEWTAEKEAYFEIRYTEIIEYLAEYFSEKGDHSRSYYYRQKLNGLT